MRVSRTLPDVNFQKLWLELEHEAYPATVAGLQPGLVQRQVHLRPHKPGSAALSRAPQSLLLPGGDTQATGRVREPVAPGTAQPGARGEGPARGDTSDVRRVRASEHQGDTETAPKTPTAGRQVRLRSEVSGFAVPQSCSDSLLLKNSVSVSSYFRRYKDYKYG